jgi:hypothetical protein
MPCVSTLHVRFDPSRKKNSPETIFGAVGFLKTKQQDA